MLEPKSRQPKTQSYTPVLLLALFCAVLTVASGLANGILFTLMYVLDKVYVTEPNIPWRTIEMCFAWGIFIVGMVTVILISRRIARDSKKEK